MQSVQTPIFSICPPCNGYGVTPESMLTGLSFLELSELETECPECFGYGLIKQSDGLCRSPVQPSDDLGQEITNG